MLEGLRLLTPGGRADIVVERAFRAVVVLAVAETDKRQVRGRMLAYPKRIAQIVERQHAAFVLDLRFHAAAHAGVAFVEAAAFDGRRIVHAHGRKEVSRPAIGPALAAEVRAPTVQHQVQRRRLGHIRTEDHQVVVRTVGEVTSWRGLPADVVIERHAFGVEELLGSFNPALVR